MNIADSSSTSGNAGDSYRNCIGNSTAFITPKNVMRSTTAPANAATSAVNADTRKQRKSLTTRHIVHSKAAGRHGIVTNGITYTRKVATARCGGGSPGLCKFPGTCGGLITDPGVTRW